MRILVIRHGESEADLLEVHEGRADFELTEREKYPPVADIPVHASVYEQESLLDFRFRAEYMLSKILSENGPDAVAAVVTHGGMLNQLYRAFLRLPVDSDIGFGTGDTGIHEWNITRERRWVVRANLTAHAEGI